jgi:hypothetical protein
VINTTTHLKFIADNLETGSHLKDLLAMVIIISNSSGHEIIFKFTNITAPNGNFSLEYLFPELGVSGDYTNNFNQSFVNLPGII